jgi:hypothetical protein
LRPHFGPSKSLWTGQSYDASQAGFNFMPHQASYQSQLGTIAKWVGMEHMHPSVVEVQLPGLRTTDTFSVTTFDFII